MAASATEEHVPLRILVDEVKNRVVFVEAGKDFVDVLLSFLTLPLGTIARLVGKESNMNKVSVGSLSSLYGSVANLEEKHFWTETCKEMLLQPRNSMEGYCRYLKLNMDDTGKTKFFICEKWDCSLKSSGALLSTFRNKRCRCGKLMNREISPQNEKIHEGFVLEMATFIISDDLKVMPDNFQACVVLPMNLGYEDFGAFKEIPLTDLFLQKKQFPVNAQSRSVLDFDIGVLEANLGRNLGGKMMKVKVMVRKSNRKILFALAEDDFVDFILSFLTFPSGGVLQVLNDNSYVDSIDNLYMSVVDLDGHKYLRSYDIRDKLVNSRLAPKFKLNNQIFPIDEEPIFNYSCYSGQSEVDDFLKLHAYLIDGFHYQKFHINSPKQEAYTPLSYLEPQSSTGEKYSSNCGRGFAKKPSLYMATDDLVVTPRSSISIFSFLTKSKIPPQDLEERIISVGQKEGLSLQKASLISSSALTTGLSQFIKSFKEEK